MDFPCESEFTVRNDNALRFEIVTKPAPVIEYLKTIASLVGASHILGVFEDGEFIKIYFDDKKIIDTLVRSGIHILGHHIKVDYVVPPGSKVILSNVDPLVSNYDLTRLVSMFGTVMSPVFRSPISDDIELCHIDHGVRYLYMKINTDVDVPETFEFQYGDQMCNINIKLDDTIVKIPDVKEEPGESNSSESSSNATLDDSVEPIIVDDKTDQVNVDDKADKVNSDDKTDPVSDDIDITNPVVVSVQSATEEVMQEQQSEDPRTNDRTNRQKSYKARGTKLIKVSQANKKIRANVKYRSKKTKNFRIFRKKEHAVLKQLPETPLNVQPSSSISSSSSDDSSMQFSDIGHNFANEDTNSILDGDQIKLFLEEVRHHRDPIEIVKKYVGPEPDALRCLIKQLIDLKTKTDDTAFRNRMRRLINNLTISNA